jgi:hypothetical protein
MWPGHDADHSPASSAKVEKEGGYTSTPQTSFMACSGSALLYFYFASLPKKPQEACTIVLESWTAIKSLLLKSADLAWNGMTCRLHLYFNSNN